MLHSLSRAAANLDAAVARYAAFRARPQLIAAIGQRKAERAYRRTVKYCPAYRDMVQRHMGSVPSSVALKDFEQLPILDKQNYIQRYPLDQICGQGITQAFTIQRSSGYSGQPCYWPRRQADMRNTRKGFHFSYDHYFSPNHEPCLFVVGFSLGTWVGGTDLFRASTDFAARTGQPLSTITPGEDTAETLEILRRFGKTYARIVVAGNPVFLKTLLDEGTDIPWQELSITFSTGGEATTESWREWIAGRLGVDIDREPMRVFNGYGATDFGGAAATESPWSIAIKRIAMGHSPLAQDLFGRPGNLPNLYQYSPLSQHFENHEGELLVTAWSQVPLVRYNVHDRGRAMAFTEVWELLLRHGVDVADLNARFGPPMRLPFLFIDTRTDGTVSIGGANVYPGNVQTALFENPVLEQNVDHFYLTVERDAEQNTQLIVELIVNALEERDAAWQTSFTEKAEAVILQTLLRDNLEYAVTWQHNQALRPVVRLQPASGHQHNSIKRHYVRHETSPGR